MSSKLLKLRLIAIGQLKLWLAAILVTACIFMLIRNETSITQFFATGADSQRNFGILVAQLSGAFTAVLLTSIALVFTLPDRPLLTEMRHSGHFLDLCATLVSAIAACIAVLLLSVILAIAQEPAIWLVLVLSTAPALAIMLLQASIRFLLTMVAMALPT